jgi:uncharacterized membrane protein HdeD (DUF308 family)
MSIAGNTRGLGSGAVIVHALARNWWLLLLRGLVSLLFGVLAFVWPGITLVSLVIVYGAFAFADGIFSIIAAIRGDTGASRWWLALVGVMGIAAGVLTFVLPVFTALTLLYLIGAWALVRGIFEIVGAIRLRKEIDNEWMLILSGLVSVLFGAYMLIAPGAGALALIWVIGAYAIIVGVLLVALAFRLRGHAH